MMITMTTAATTIKNAGYTRALTALAWVLFIRS